MASPYNTTDEMNSRQNGSATSGSNTTAEHFDSNQAPDWMTSSGAASSSQSSGQSSGQSSTSASSAQKSASRAEGSKKSQSASQQGSRPAQFRQGISSQQSNASGTDILKGSLSNAFDQIVKEIEPQINEFASSFAHQAIAKGEDFGRQAVKRVQGQSWGRIAFAGALFVGALAVLSYQAAEAISENDSLH